jgi:predicted component of type VI protein secretion system
MYEVPGFAIPKESRVVGDRLQDIVDRIRIRLETADWESYLRFLPGGNFFPTRMQIVRQFIKDMPDVLVVPSMPFEATRAAQLTGGDFRLGLNTWLGAPDGASIAWPSFTIGYS